MGGRSGPPICSDKQVILLVQDMDGVRERALALFAGRVRRILGLQQDACILISSNHEVRQLNRRYRQMDQPTDVLSFPAVSKDFLGDIAISSEIAARNAGKLGHSVETELRILILHGLLHLAGYDHERDNGEMEAREFALRREFKLPAGLLERTHGAAASPPRAPRRRRRKAAR